MTVVGAIFPRRKEIADSNTGKARDLQIAIPASFHSVWPQFISISLKWQFQVGGEPFELEPFAWMRLINKLFNCILFRCGQAHYDARFSYSQVTVHISLWPDEWTTRRQVIFNPAAILCYAALRRATGFCLIYNCTRHKIIIPDWRYVALQRLKKFYSCNMSKWFVNAASLRQFPLVWEAINTRREHECLWSDFQVLITITLTYQSRRIISWNFTSSWLALVGCSAVTNKGAKLPPNFSPGRRQTRATGSLAFAVTSYLVPQILSRGCAASHKQVLAKSYAWQSRRPPMWMKNILSLDNNHLYLKSMRGSVPRQANTDSDS